MAFIDDEKWFQEYRATTRYSQLTERPVAYLCAEFALADGTPTYSGGLGVLAGDVVREAADQALPMIAVGLYYNKGYICKKVQEGGQEHEVCEDIPPESVGMVPVTDDSGKRIQVQVPVQDRQVVAQVWRYDVQPTTPSGAIVPVYLMDTNVPENSEADRAITDRLYTGEKQTRLQQEIVLGIGGMRLVETLGIHPSVYHLNEGHSAFLTIALIRHQMDERKIGFDEAKQFARRRVVFTNHTLVPAGNEVYDNDLVSLMLGSYCQELGIPIQEMLSLGLIHESSTFSMTMLSMRMAGIVNGVSKLHAEKAKEVWTSHPMVGITNGVHVPTWDQMSEVAFTEPGAVWRAHQVRKRKLLEFVGEQTGRSWDPDTLLLAWARRIARYKRPLAILEDAKRFASIARQLKRPVRVLIAGQPHPSDEDGAEMLSELRKATGGLLGDFAAYIPDYSMEEARLMVSGSDVWLNTPIIGYEASGTSGMKAALNGSLPLSTRDGWVDEVDLLNVGWPADSERIGESLLDVVEKEIVPLYYDRGAHGVPEAWERNMKNARSMVLDRFSATRMLREYCELLYS